MAKPRNTTVSPAKKAAAKKVSAKKASRKPAKPAPQKAATPTKPPVASEKKSRKPREKKKLFATVALGKLTDLLGGDANAEVVVSRNFVLDQKKAQIEAEATEALGI